MAPRARGRAGQHKPPSSSSAGAGPAATSATPQPRSRSLFCSGLLVLLLAWGVAVFNDRSALIRAPLRLFALPIRASRWMRGVDPASVPSAEYSLFFKAYLLKLGVSPKEHGEAIAAMAPAEVVRLVRAAFDDMYLPLDASTTVTHVTIPTQDGVGIPGRLLAPEGADESKLVVYYHGGAYLAGGFASHQRGIAALAGKLGVPVLLVGYRLIPEVGFPTPLEDCYDAYKWALNDHGLPAKSVALAGESAGANAVLGVVLKAHEARVPLPAALGVFSAWIDMTFDFASFGASPDDLLTTTQVSYRLRELLLGSTNPTLAADDPLVSPGLADWTGIAVPPTLIQYGHLESLRSANEALYAKFKSLGVQVEHDVLTHTQHNIQLMYELSDEGMLALEHEVAFLRKHLFPAAAEQQE